MLKDMFCCCSDRIEGRVPEWFERDMTFLRGLKGYG